VSNLTSSVSGAFDAFYNVLVTAGNAQNPPVPVIAQEVTQYEPGAYVCLGTTTPSGRKPIENHRYEPAALGSFAFYEDYEFHGYATVFAGDVDPETVLSKTWTVYQNVVMQTAVTYSGSFPSGGGQILGSAAPTTLEWFIPQEANYTGYPGMFPGGVGGFQGVVEFGFALRARLTVA
jgi:hypothetical protein